MTCFCYLLVVSLASVYLIPGHIKSLNTLHPNSLEILLKLAHSIP